MIIVLRLTVELDSFAGENFRKFLRENPTQIHNRPRTPTHCSFALLVRALLRVDYVLPKPNVHCNWVIVSRIHVSSPACPAHLCFRMQLVGVVKLVTHFVSLKLIANMAVTQESTMEFLVS